MDFENQVVVVTGGASGMGAACAEGFARAGAHVYVVDRDANAAAEIVARLEMARPGGARAVVGDVSDAAFCNSVIQTALQHHGRLDVLVNAAGIIVRAAGANTSNEDWSRIMGVNVSGTFFMCRAALHAMKQTGVGAIVNFGSIWGDVGAAGVAAYCASKGAVHNLTRALALEHATDGIRINAVCPGEVNTPMLRSGRNEAVTAATLAAIAQTVPMQRLADPLEVANVVLFLASCKASYMTGALVTVDAGFTAR